MVELTSKQCDAAMKRFCIHVKYGQREDGYCKWHCIPHSAGEDVCSAPTREAAITAYWQKYHPFWTPPVIHDEAWALRYAKRLNIRLEYSPYGHKGAFWKAGQYEIHNATGTTLVGVVLAWKAKYDTPKPTREETAMELLKEARQVIPCLNQIGYGSTANSIAIKIDTFIEEASDVDE